MNTRPSSLLFLAPLLAMPAMALAQDGPDAECDEASGRCAAIAVLTSDSGERFGTVGIQIGKDGSDPFLVAIAPLGIAVAPGVRVVTDGSGDHDLAVDACFPDGCRATMAIAPDDLAAISGAERWSLQFFPFGADKPLSADLDPKPLIEGLRGAGVTLP